MSIYERKNMVDVKNIEETGGKTISNVIFEDCGGYIDKAVAILETVGNLRLVGETGTGKTTLVYKLAEKLGVPLYEEVLTQDTTRWDLLACDVLKGGETQVRYGIVLKWLLNGGMLYLDGFNYGRASLLSLLECLSDFRGTVWIPELGKSFKRTEKHYLVISFNPAEKSNYSGTMLTNIATMRRFEGLIVDYMSPHKEKTLVKRYSNDYDFASKFVEIARKTRDLYRRGSLRTPLTTGNLINYANLFAERGLSEEDIIEIASSLYPDDERELFRSLFEKSGEIDVDSLKENEENND